MTQRSTLIRRLAALEETARQRSPPVVLPILFTRALTLAYGEPGDEAPEAIPLSVALVRVDAVYAEAGAAKAQ